MIEAANAADQSTLGITTMKTIQFARALLGALIGVAVLGAVVTGMAGTDIIGKAALAAADMPCCPDKSIPMDCDQCPLMALCMVTNFHVPLSVGMIEIRPVTVRLLAPASDPQADSLGQHPPPRPPRSLVHSA